MYRRSEAGDGDLGWLLFVAFIVWLFSARGRFWANFGKTVMWLIFLPLIVVGGLVACGVFVGAFR
jgi:hypothetical protein